jgi:hypothetical protein
VVLWVKRVAFGLAAALAVLLAVGYRELQCLPVGGGQIQASPDGRLEAKVFNQTEQFFWGGHRDWTEYSVTNRKGVELWKKTVEDTDSSVGWRSAGEIVWEPDSSKVTFRYPRQDGKGFLIQVKSPPLPASSTAHRPAAS